VLEIACGPGVNFPFLEEAIGPSGRLAALDYSEEMLAAARKRARIEGWHNIDFVHGDAARSEWSIRGLVPRPVSLPPPVSGKCESAVLPRVVVNGSCQVHQHPPYAPARSRRPRSGGVK
jgi:SAM-dependent methyltransferase